MKPSFDYGPLVFLDLHHHIWQPHNIISAFRVQKTERLFWAKLAGEGFLKPVELESGFADELNISNTIAMNPLIIQYSQFQWLGRATEDTVAVIPLL